MQKINIFKDEQNRVVKNNIRNFIIGIVIIITLTIIMAKSGEGLIASLILGFVVIGIVVVINNSNLNEFEEKRLEKCINSLKEVHGDYSLKIGKNSIESIILLSPL